MSVTNAIIEILRAMPDDVTWAEIVAAGNARFGSNDNSEDDATFDSTLKRRLDELESGKVKGVPAEQVMHRLSEKYQQ